MGMFGEIAVESFKKRVIEKLEKARDARGRAAQSAGNPALQTELANIAEGLTEAITILHDEPID